MLGQLQMMPDGTLLNKVELAIRRLQSFEPPEGYYHTMSFGKDSQCTYHLCKMAGVKFDSHYAVTSCDPPELIWFGREHYPDVIWEHQYYDDGVPRHYFRDGRPKPITMWSLIADHTLPPTRKVRYCCAHLKEPGGGGRVVVTGVRWAESNNRRVTHGVVGFQGKPVNTRKTADALGASYKLNKHGEVIMNDDNDANRRMVEQCFRTRKTMVNPIVDWTDEDVWEFLNSNNIPHCSLYDEGFKRLGCIGCPLSGTKNMIRDFERWPKYKDLYIRAFQRMIDNHPGQIKILDPNADTKFKLDVYENAGGVFSEIGSTRAIDERPGGDGSEFRGGQSVLQQSCGGHALVRAGVELTPCSDSSSTTATAEIFRGGGGTNSPSRCSDDGSKRRCAEYLVNEWIQYPRGRGIYIRPLD